jgi:aminopeptidase N
MQEPFGALTWYPVNDHPSDKAMYDVRVSTPGRWVGVSTGRLVRRVHEGGRTRTRWTNADPMASYLMTLAVGPYRVFRQRGPHDLPLTYWVPRSRPQLVRPLLRTPKALRWLESRLGPYPFDRAGVVVVPGTGSAMETQTLVTFGAGRYRDDAFSVRETMVHELAHQWYGDAVTPRDWRDLWLNEGMATYLDARWAVDQGRGTWRGHVRSWASQDQLLRDVYGPPGDFLRDEFASNNVYYCTALMWERLRLRLGDGTFDRLVRAWPQQHRNTNQTRRSYVAWIEAETGEELTSFFRRWLTSSTSPIG